MIDPVILAQRAQSMVDAGVQLLNKSLNANAKGPWWRNIVADEIDQSSLKKDVLGQIFGDYEVGMEALDMVDSFVLNGVPITRSDAYKGGRYGFALGGLEYMTWDVLNGAWRIRIRLIQQQALMNA